MTMEDANRAWVYSVPGIGPKQFAHLESVVDSLNDLYTLSSSSLRKLGISDRIIHALVAHRQQHNPTLIHEYCEKEDIKIVCKDSDTYSPLLLQIPDPPALLYVRGTMPDWSRPCIAVVGTRNITQYGKEVTTFFVHELVKLGFTIVSGFMYGVDAAAHTACLDSGGKTIGVLGFGLNTMYPSSHRELADRVIQQGSCLMSEYAPWIKPSRMTFPARNRIVSGLSLGVLVIEAAAKSGSKITARLAVEQGREVFAVPGPIDSLYSEGTKELVNIGAKLVTHVADIVEELSV